MAEANIAEEKLPKAQSWSTSVNEEGEYVRKDSQLRGLVKADSSTAFIPEPDRYRLYVSYACPWASRALAFRAIKGLEHAIPVTVVGSVMERTRPDDPEDTHEGWAFKPEGFEPDTTPDPLGAKYIRDIYEKVGAPKNQAYSVPILFDTHTGQIVNNESSEIIRMFNWEFNDLAKHPDLELVPRRFRDKIDEVNDWVYHGINNGVYKSGFARSQAAYDKAVTALFECLDRVEGILGESRYLVGDVLTEADIRLFVTLVRFDPVYVCHFKCCYKAIREYPHMYGYLKDIYQTPGIADTVNMFHIKTHYYRSHKSINPFGIIANTNDGDLWEPHGRDATFPEAKKGAKYATTGGETTFVPHATRPAAIEEGASDASAE